MNLIWNQNKDYDHEETQPLLSTNVLEMFPGMDNPVKHELCRLIQGGY